MARERVPVTLRLPPALSAKLTALAAARGVSLNEFMIDKLRKEIATEEESNGPR